MQGNIVDILAKEFFKKFSAFEFFLKEKGYVKGVSRGISEQASQIAVVDYKAFYEQYRNNELTGNAKALLANPPKQQVLIDGCRLAWEDRGYEQSFKGAVEALKQLRNNLFHGAKHVIGGEFEDNKRNSELLRCGIRLLDDLEGMCNRDGLSLIHI